MTAPNVERTIRETRARLARARAEVRDAQKAYSAARAGIPRVSDPVLAAAAALLPEELPQYARLTELDGLCREAVQLMGEAAARTQAVSIFGSDGDTVRSARVVFDEEPAILEATRLWQGLNRERIALGRQLGRARQTRVTEAALARSVARQRQRRADVLMPDLQTGLLALLRRRIAGGEDPERARVNRVQSAAADAGD